MISKLSLIQDNSAADKHGPDYFTITLPLPNPPFNLPLTSPLPPSQITPYHISLTKYHYKYMHTKYCIRYMHTKYYIRYIHTEYYLDI